MAKKQKNNNVTYLEQGQVYFFYKPKVETEDVSSMNEVQRLYMVLHPYNENRYRLLVLGQKKLPKVEEHQNYWAFVSRVLRDPDKLREDLKPESHKTKTRGVQHRGVARPAGEGVYGIVTHGDHTHLVYDMELPNNEETNRRVQKAFRIREKGSYVISVKNPEKPANKSVGLSGDKQASYPKKLQERFEDRKFISVNPPDFLNHEYAELVLVGAAGDYTKELGIELNTEEESLNTADVFEDLRISREHYPLEPLFHGTWA
ncbi:MAG: hypothetical protein ACOCXQ_02745 [Patescibacteria group bacterium]